MRPGGHHSVSSTSERMRAQVKPFLWVKIMDIDDKFVEILKALSKLNSLIGEFVEQKEMPIVNFPDKGKLFNWVENQRKTGVGYFSVRSALTDGLGIHDCCITKRDEMYLASQLKHMGVSRKRLSLNKRRRYVYMFDATGL
jgi:hypothetical protein